MALDGAFLRHLRQELEQNALGARVDRIYQPNREEIVLFLRTRGDSFKLLLSARANSARIHFTRFVPENPKVPPMLCMLLRKHLTGARLAAVRQPGLERVLFLDFDTFSELGDEIRLTLAVEIMGRYSNVIFFDQDEEVIDALKRVNAEMSSERLVLPGLKYRLPPPQDKLCLTDVSPERVMERLFSLPADRELSKALLASLQGVSPVVCRELQHRVGLGADDVTVRTMTEEQKERLRVLLDRTAELVRSTAGRPFMVSGPDGKPMDFSFLEITQYGNTAAVTEQESFSGLLDAFYAERDRMERMRVRAQDLLRVLATASERLSRKINLQRAELEHCAERDRMRICGDLISANLYRMEKGVSCAELENFYDPSLPPVRVKLDPALTPSQNAQKYYKAYRKARTAEEILTAQIRLAQNELAYLDTVSEELSRAATERDLSEIRAELAEQGYLRVRKEKQKQPAPEGPMEFCSSDGLRILVGRNNRQNDHLTLRQAHRHDLWFHTKNIPGSHTILVTGGGDAPRQSVVEAASLAAFYSKSRHSSQVPVDYTEVRNVSKPQGAKPGMVIYVGQKTLYVTPEEALAQWLKTQ